MRDQTKTNEGRKIPISPVLDKTLRNMVKKSRPTDPVFDYKGKSVKSVKRSFNTACEKAGIKDFKFHDFRHTFVTRMRRAGKHDRVIMAVTGHRSLLTLARYDTLDEDRGRSFS